MFRHVTYVVLLCTLVASPLAAQGPRPSPVQYVYQEQERIQFVALDPCTWQGREYDNHSTDLKTMTLPKLDTDQWCAAARSWGAKEILFVAKHTGGFCWWQTDTTDYSVKNIGWKNGKGDLLEDLARSCGKYGLNMGIYVYPGDATWGAGIGSGGRTKDPKKQAAYNKVFRQQLRETLQKAAKHTRVIEVWFDGSCVIEVGDILEAEAPDAVVFQGPHATIRWVGNEKGILPYPSWNTLDKQDLAVGTATARHSKPEGDAWAPLEADTTLYDHAWFWSAAKEKKRKSLDQLMWIYYMSVGRGGTLLLNSTPNTDGLIPVGDMERYRQFGAELARRFDAPVGSTSGRGKQFVIELDKPAIVNHAVIMEDYWFGERIRAWVLEGFDGQAWIELSRGRSVGRKHIAWFNDMVVAKVRLRVTQAVAEPLVRKLAVFHVSGFRAAPGKPLRSEWRQCGAWTVADFSDDSAQLTVDLTGHITEAGQWQVRFQPAAQQAMALHNEVLLQQGQRSAPGMLSRVEGQPYTFHVNRTAVITKSADIRLRVTLTGQPSQGVILIRQVP